MIELGGTKAWKVKLKGDVVIAYHWVNNEPAMCLYKKGAMLVNRPGAFVIPLESAFKYAESKTGMPTPYAIKRAVTAAEVMGFFPDRSTVIRIVDAILDGLVELIEMPPEPTGLNRKDTDAVGEILLKIGGKTVVEGEINAGNELITT